MSKTIYPNSKKTNPFAYTGYNTTPKKEPVGKHPVSADTRISTRPYSRQSHPFFLPVDNQDLANTGTQRWMIPYADFLTVLLGFFLVLLVTMVRTEKLADSSEVRLASPGKVQSGESLLNTIPSDSSVENDMDDLASALSPQARQQASQNGISIRQQPWGLVISFKEHILFEPGRAQLSQKAAPRMEKLIRSLRDVLSEHPHPVRVEGHTDNTPINTVQFHSNWELSTARATTIVRYLVEQQHFSPQQLSAVGYGEFSPIDDNSSIKGKQNNRRVDIVILSGYGVQNAYHDSGQNSSSPLMVDSLANHQ
jgi:chemotaxis protein MotB